MEKKNVYIIILSASLALIISSIIFLCVANGIFYKHRYTDGVERYGFEIAEVAIHSYDVPFYLYSGKDEYKITDKEKQNEIRKSLDTSVWYRTDAKKKTNVVLKFTSKKKITYKITLCEDNVIYYDGKYFVNDDGSIFHDTVVNAIS